jgi:dipeptidyl aminopeptidase/acylaminoacyl peptidase
MTATLPYGAWPSPITAAHLVEHSVGLSDLDVVDGDLVWIEQRASDQGRQVVVRHHPGGEPVDLIPPPFSARTSVHEYGGRPFVVSGQTCWFVNFADQRIWSVTDGGEPRPLTPEPETPRAVRYADLVVDRRGAALLAVRERHGVDGVDGALGVVNDLVRIDTDGARIEVIASGHDFYAAPRLAPDGRRIVFLAWDHPAMPWDSSRLYAVDAANPGDPELLAGGEGEAISQPRFSPDGTLHFLSDRSGFTSLYRQDGTAVIEIGADLAEPDWVFGQSSYDFLPDGSVVAAVETVLGSSLTHFGRGGARRLADRFDVVSSVRAVDGAVVALVGSAVEPAAVARIDLAGGTAEVVRASRVLPVDLAYLSRPEPITVTTARGVTHAIYYPPTNPDATAPENERPPLVVMSHGGPTGRTVAQLNLRVQYFTSRGIAVVDVNYGGSSGFGRAYRERLDGQWGVVDVEDCVAVARSLAEAGRADARRLAIRGGSAGGYTTLCALAFSDTFAVGASHYGVSDLVALATETHKFEARYLDRLVGPLPDAAATYEARSPLVHAGEIRCPVIFFQGLDDHVVPPAQAEVLVGALRARGIPVAYVPIPGEGHGFRRAESIVSVAEAELAFFAEVLGFVPADRLAPVRIENASALVGARTVNREG